ncbi:MULTISPECIES: hypothetical protein [Flavobacteriales]|nr:MULTISPECIES: hypothetical protein [Flavobacteriales]
MNTDKNKSNEQITIKLLDQKDWKIVKEISVVSTNQFGVEKY